MKHGHLCLVVMDYELPEGYKLAEGEEKYTTVSVPFGAASGVTLTVEPINGTVDPVKPAKETVLNITFETVDGTKVGETTAKTTVTGGEGEAWTFMLGQDYQLPEGYKLAEGKDQTTNIQIPFGAVGGATIIVEPIKSDVTPKETVLTITFETVDGTKCWRNNSKDNINRSRWRSMDIYAWNRLSSFQKAIKLADRC